ncbi:hypothetical protein BT63DRAFT_391697 [Microthyrium microscopicum]|uniref:Uncharacterized protein n=1 Tax=Microthyrium microscopicum TaxID=703497 RepID=A0A6A6TZJ9_9PEZI|nr:hypothetical protein BT63DRAFT_391697 [Microthyrium microscopicum]
MSTALLNTLTNLKVTASQLKRQALKAETESKSHEKKAENAMAKGQQDIARIYMESSIQKSNEHKNVLKLSVQVEMMAAKVRTASTMQTMGRNMAQATKAMENAARAMDVEAVTLIMDRFQESAENVDVTVGTYEHATSSVIATAAPTEQVDEMMARLADKVGVKLQQDLDAAKPADNKVGRLDEQESGLEDRLKAIRNTA